MLLVHLLVAGMSDHSPLFPPLQQTVVEHLQLDSDTVDISHVGFPVIYDQAHLTALFPVLDLILRNLGYHYHFASLVNLCNDFHLDY